MKKRYTNLNEEVNRIKSLFTEERLYGNLKQNKLLTEQGIGKKLADALETASSSVAKAIKNVDPKLATNFLNSEINTFDDLAKHLNDYKSIWKAMGINWDYTNDVVLNFRKWSKSGYLKTAKEDLVLQVINDLPKEGDIRGIVYDLWIDSKGKYTPPKPKSKNQTTIVTKSKSGENVIHKVETVGGKENIETYTIENDGIKKDETYDPNRASEEVNAHFDGDDLVSGGGSSKITTDVLNSKGNPDNIKGEIINAIEEGFNKVSGRGGKKMTSDEIIQQVESGKVLLVKQSDGSTLVINTIELVEWTIDETGKLTSFKNLKSSDVTGTTPPVKDGGGDSGSGSLDGGKKGKDKSKSNFSSNISQIIGQGLRFTFPSASQVLKVISLAGPGKKFYSKQRFSFADVWSPSSGDYSSKWNKFWKNIEGVARVLFVEQAALITIVGISKSIERGTLPKDEESINTAIADYANSEVWKYTIPYLLAGGLVDVYQRVINLRKISYASCRSNAEKKLNPNDPLYKIKKKEIESEIEACKDEVDSFFDKIESFGKDFTKFKKEFAYLSNINQWDQSKIEKFCEEDLADKQEVLKNLRVSLTNLDDDIKNRFNTDDIKKRQYVVSIISTLKNVMPALPDLPSYEEIISQLMPNTKFGGKTITPLDIQGLENKLNAACAEYWNKKRDIQDQIVDPDDYEQPIDTINIDPDTKESLDADFGKLEIIVEPVDIV